MAVDVVSFGSGARLERGGRLFAAWTFMAELFDQARSCCGAEEENADKLVAFQAAVNSNDNSHLVTVPPGTILSDQLFSTPIFMEEGADAGGPSASEAIRCTSEAACMDDRPGSCLDLFTHGLFPLSCSSHCGRL